MSSTWTRSTASGSPDTVTALTTSGIPVTLSSTSRGVVRSAQ